ncbi:MAG: N-acetylmuramoyl-L-alanine amidase [Eubacteriales bacterium]|nr:N-acetylmuramoyl-L-alanine amidase [Eubacteriales bacterium]
MADRISVVIDAGHGGQEPGAVWEGRQEKDDTLRLALAVGQILTENGVDVSYTRVTDVYHQPIQKAEMANHADGDLFLSIHRNAMPVPGTASGIQSLVYENEGTAGAMAFNINQALTNMGWKDLGVVKRPGLVVLRKTEMPAVLVEAGFLDHEDDNRFFDENFEKTAKAIADGVLETIRQEEEEGPAYYQVQTGVFKSREDAERLLYELQAEDYPAFIVAEDGLYKVRAGAFLNVDNAAWMEKRLRAAGYPTMMILEGRR